MSVPCFLFSERVKQTEATGDRFTEAKSINLSLMTLGNVIKGKLDTSRCLRKLPRATTNVQKNKSYVGLFISYVGLFISYVGDKIS